ncbi:MAG: glycosyltransferase [bacterium]
MISIIIPTLNEEKFLEKTIKNLSLLSEFDYEIIVSDGKSKDKTLEIARKYANKVVEQVSDERQTISAGRNAGAKIAQGDFLVFVDSDVLIPNINIFFAKALDFFRDDNKLVALSVFMKVYPKSATLSDKFFFSIINTYHYILNNFFHVGSSSGEFQMIKSESFKMVDGYNEKIAAGEDGDIFSRLSKIGRTKISSNIFIEHSSRRAHAIGWGKLFSLYILNGIFVKLFKRAFSKEWKPVR